MTRKAADSRVGRLIVATSDSGLAGQLRDLAAGADFSLEVVADGKALLKCVPGLGWWEGAAVILLDEEVADGSGHAIIPELKRLRGELKIVFVAAHPTPELEVAVRRHGVYMFLAKPVGAEMLRKVIAKALDHTTRVLRPLAVSQRIAHG